MAQDANKSQLGPQTEDLITPRRKALSVAALTEIEQYAPLILSALTLIHLNTHSGALEQEV